MSNYFDDERGYIEVYDLDDNRMGYLRSLDYSTLEYVLTDDLDYAKRYIQEDLIYHDVVILQGYCNRKGCVFVPKLPFSTF